MAIQILITSQAGEVSDDICCCPVNTKFVAGNSLGYDFIRYSEVTDLNQYAAEADIIVGGQEYRVVITLAVDNGSISGYAVFRDLVTQQITVNVLEPQSTVYPRLPIYNIWNRVRLPLYNEFVELSLFDDRPLLDLEVGDSRGILLYQQIVLSNEDFSVKSPWVLAPLQPSVEKNGRFVDNWSLLNPLISTVDYDPLPWRPQNAGAYPYTRYSFLLNNFKVYTAPGMVRMEGFASMRITPEHADSINNSAKFNDPRRISSNNLIYPWVTKFVIVDTGNTPNSLIRPEDLLTFSPDPDLTVSVNAYLLGYDVSPG